MYLPIRALAGLAVLCALSVTATDAAAQGFGDRLKKKAQERVAKATDAAAEKTVDKAESTVKCAVTDKACADKAAAEGKKVEATGGADAAVTPAGTSVAASAAARPGTGAWANYDFVPGTRPLYVDDFSRDAVGDFPRRMEFRSGALEIVEWNDARWLRASAQSSFFLQLPEVLPSSFTLEFDYASTYNHDIRVMFGENERIRVEFTGNGAAEVNNYDTKIHATGRYDENRDGNRLFRARVLGDGRYVKVYVNEKRVLNVPNADLQRSRRIQFYVEAAEGRPSLLGNFSVMAGGRKLYDALAESGRVATQGIFFDTGSDVIRPESSPTLKEIAAMLKEHGDLSLVIEGHTDNVGQAAANLSLSERRAAAVKAALVGSYGVDGARLSSRGLGDTKPAARNDTAEGRQQNRRVELVKG